MQADQIPLAGAIASVRTGQACKSCEAYLPPSNTGHALPDDASSIREWLQVLSQEITSSHAALDASVSDVNKLCEGDRWLEEKNSDAENAQAMQQWLARSLTWTEASNGNTKIQITLPSELAQAFLNSVEQSVNQTDI